MKVAVVNRKESVIYKRKVFKYGEVIDMDSKVAESLIKRGFVEAIEEEVEVVTGYLDENQLGELSYQELKRLAKQMGVSASGTKEELIERIKCTEVEVSATDDIPEGAEIIGDEDGDMPNTSMPE